MRGRIVEESVEGGSFIYREDFSFLLNFNCLKGRLSIQLLTLRAKSENEHIENIERLIMNST